MNAGSSRRTRVEERDGGVNGDQVTTSRLGSNRAKLMMRGMRRPPEWDAKVPEVPARSGLTHREIWVITRNILHYSKARRGVMAILDAKRIEYRRPIEAGTYSQVTEGRTWRWTRQHEASQYSGDVLLRSLDDLFLFSVETRAARLRHREETRSACHPGTKAKDMSAGPGSRGQSTLCKEFQEREESPYIAG